MWAETENANYTVTGISNELGTVGTEFLSNSVENSTYHLTATPAYGYGLDRWEYKGESTGGDWKAAPDSNGKAAYTVTIDEDREYRAVFVPRFFTAKAAYPTASVYNSDLNLYGFAHHLATPSPVTRTRHGGPALFVVEADMPHMIVTKATDHPDYYDHPVLSWRIDVYAGESADPENLLYTRDPTAAGYPDNLISTSKITLLIESMPYTEKVTVVSTTGGEGQDFHVVDTQTLDISKYMVEDTLKGEREAAVAQLDAARAEARATDRYESSLEVQAVIAKIYSDAVSAIDEVGIDVPDGAALIAERAALAIGYMEAAIATTTDEELLALNGVDFGQMISVVVTAEDFTSPELPPHFIVEPKLMIVPQGTMAMPVIWRALEETYPPDELGFLPYDSGDDFLFSMYDPAIGGTPGEYSENKTGPWMYWVTGEGFPGHSAGEHALKDGDVMRWMATRDQGKDLRGGSAPLSKKVAYINRAGNKDDYGEAYTNAMAVLVDRDATAQDVSTALAALNAKGGPDAVTDLIDAIGEVGVGSGAAIAEARLAYNALTDDQRSQIGNGINTLKAAEAAYEALKPAIEALALIEAIGGVTPQSGAAIQAARDAYDALSEENKAHVNLAALLAAEAAYEALTQPGGGTGDGTDIGDVLAATLARLKATAENESPGVAFTNGEWAVLALARGGAMTDQIKNNYLANLRVAIAAAESNQDGKVKLEANKPTENARVALALSALGIDASAFEGSDLVTPLADGDWAESQGINGAVFALLALDAKPYFPENEAIRGQYVGYILNNQHDDGGWSLEEDKEDPSDPDITAMALQALAPHQTDSEVRDAVYGGLEALLDMQDENHGGFYNSRKEYNSEGAAQAIVALTALGTSPEDDGWTVGDGKNPLTALLSFHGGEGSFRHTAGGGANTIATEQAAYALVAYDRFKNSENPLYDMSDAAKADIPEAADKKELAAAIAKAKALDAKGYTAASWHALQTALTAAESVNADGGAAQAAVNAAAAALRAAIAALVPERQTDKTALDAATAQAGALKEAGYTAESWAALQKALAAAKAVSASAGATQDDVDAAAAALKAAVGALVAENATQPAVTIPTPGGGEMKVSVADTGSVTVDAATGVSTLTEGGSMTAANGAAVALPAGTTIAPDGTTTLAAGGTLALPGASVGGTTAPLEIHVPAGTAIDPETGTATIATDALVTLPGADGRLDTGGTFDVKVPAGTTIDPLTGAVEIHAEGGLAPVAIPGGGAGGAMIPLLVPDATTIDLLSGALTVRLAAGGVIILPGPNGVIDTRAAVARAARGAAVYAAASEGDDVAIDAPLGTTVSPVTGITALPDGRAYYPDGSLVGDEGWGYSSGGSGGGCGTGLAGAAALLALAVGAALRRRAI